jgi:hypothetical protein
MSHETAKLRYVTVTPVIMLCKLLNVKKLYGGGEGS